MNTLVCDLRFAVRMLRKSPGFALVAIVSLALGIGANTAIFSLIDSVLLRMLPVSHPEQLRFVNTNAIKTGDVQISRSLTLGVLRAMQERAHTVLGLCASEAVEKLNVGVNGQADLASGEFVSGNYFSMLGVPALIGRTFAPADDTPDGRLAVIGFGYWQKRFGEDPGVIGRPINVNGVPFRIAAVTPREFYGTSMDAAAEIMMPRATMPQVQEGRLSSAAPKPSDSAGFVFARLPAGTDKSVEAELTGIFRQEAVREAPDNPQERESARGFHIELTSSSHGFSMIRERFSQPLKVLMVVVGLVMLIACANIANLLLSKASARQREIAIRLSLGSTRARLVRQLLTESVLLSVLGGALGLLFAVWARDGIIFLGTRAGAAPAIPAAWNWRVLGFTAGISILNALLFGIVPALRASRLEFAEALKSGRTGRAAGRLPLARVLVAAQVALSLALLVGAGLFLGTFRNLDRIDLGFARDRALMVTVDPSLAGFKGSAAQEIYRQILERAGRVHGVRSVGFMESRLMSGRIQMGSVFVPGYIPRKGEDARNLWVISNEVTPAFFANAGMHLAAGRDFTDRDTAAAPPVAVINETMAQHFFGARNPIGERVAWDPNEPPMTIVAVVRDFKIFGVRAGRQDVIFTPSLQSKPAASATLLVRTEGDPLRVAPDIRAAIRAVDGRIPQFDVMTMDTQVENSLSQERLLAVLATVFGGLALALAAIGLYGVLSYGVTQRTGEIGLRMALGAERGRILRLILGETARLVAIGIGAGIAIAWIGARAVEKMLYGVKPADAWSLGSAVAILATVALLAGFLPARRASRVQPMVALRHE
jgi:predicted permease